MDFFEAQDHAYKRSKWLVVYFFAAVILIVAAVYCAVTAGVFFYHFKVGSEVMPPFFSGSRMALTGLVVVPMIGLGSLWRISKLRSVGGHGVAKSLGGRRIKESTRRREERKLRNIVEEMAIASGVPVPGIYVMGLEDGINAFAAGFSFEDAVIGVTRGAIDQLDREELQGVVAHEFSHILNGDMRLNTKLSGWIFGIVMLTMLGRGFWHFTKGSGDSGGGSGWRFGSSGGGGSSNRDSKGGGGGAIILAIILVGVLVTIIGFIGEFFARLIQAAVSRQREYLADASAVQFTRNPEGIGNALRRIGGFSHLSVLKNPNTSEFAHSFFAKSLRSEVSFLATHPPLRRRIHRLLKDWDGKFLKPRPPIQESQHEPKKKRNRKSDFGQQVSGSPQGWDDIQKLLTAGVFIRSLGKLKRGSQVYAKKIRLDLESQWPEVLEAADRSPGFILALLFHPNDTIADKQLEQLRKVFPERIERVAEYGEKFRVLGRSERLLLLELLAGRLSDALIESEYDDYLSCVRAFVEVDSKILPFEIACLQIIRRHLLHESFFAPRKSDRSEVVDAARVLASRLARETKMKGQSVGDILKSASKQAPYLINELKPVKRFSQATLDGAFTTLSRTPFRIRKQFLKVCERIVAADEKATIEEVELLRAIAIGLGVPASPIFPEMEEQTT